MYIYFLTNALPFTITPPFQHLKYKPKMSMKRTVDQMTVSFKCNNNARKGEHQNLENKQTDSLEICSYAWCVQKWTSHKTNPIIRQLIPFSFTHSMMHVSLFLLRFIQWLIILTAELNIKYTAYSRIGICSQQLFCTLPEL